MARFTVTRGKDDQFYFNFSGNGEKTILKSEGYKSKSSCLEGIESVKKNAVNEEHYNRKKAASGEHFFNLVGKNGEVIGTSLMYENETIREEAIDRAMKEAPQSPTEEQ